MLPTPRPSTPRSSPTHAQAMPKEKHYFGMNWTSKGRRRSGDGKPRQGGRSPICLFPFTSPSLPAEFPSSQREVRRRRRRGGQAVKMGTSRGIDQKGTCGGGREARSSNLGSLPRPFRNPGVHRWQLIPRISPCSAGLRGSSATPALAGGCEWRTDKPVAHIVLDKKSELRRIRIH